MTDVSAGAGNFDVIDGFVVAVRPDVIEVFEGAVKHAGLNIARLNDANPESNGARNSNYNTHIWGLLFLLTCSELPSEIMIEMWRNRVK